MQPKVLRNRQRNAGALPQTSGSSHSPAGAGALCPYLSAPVKQQNHHLGLKCKCPKLENPKKSANNSFNANPNSRFVLQYFNRTGYKYKNTSLSGSQTNLSARRQSQGSWGFAEQSRQMSTHQTEGTQQSYDSKNTRMVVCVVCKNRKRRSKVSKQCSAGMRGSQ